MPTPHLTDADWLDMHNLDDIDEYDFSERVSIKLEAFEKPTLMQITAARLAAFEEMTCTTAR